MQSELTLWLHRQLFVHQIVWFRQCEKACDESAIKEVGDLAYSVTNLRGHLYSKFEREKFNFPSIRSTTNSDEYPVNISDYLRNAFKEFLDDDSNIANAIQEIKDRPIQISDRHPTVYQRCQPTIELWKSNPHEVFKRIREFEPASCDLLGTNYQKLCNHFDQLAHEKNKDSWSYYFQTLRANPKASKPSSNIGYLYQMIQQAYDQRDSKQLEYWTGEALKRFPDNEFALLRRHQFRLQNKNCSSVEPLFRLAESAVAYTAQYEAYTQLQLFLPDHRFGKHQTRGIPV